MLPVSIIIPTRNEGENIGPLLERIAKAISERAQDTEIIFVDDASTDTTREEIRNYSGPLNVRLICRDDVCGLATAVCAGAHAAGGELLVVMDADLSHPPEMIPDLLAPLQVGSHDMVIGSRYTQGGSTPEWPLWRRLASRLATLPACLFTEAGDPLAGFFAVRRETFLSIWRPVAGFKIGLEILASAGDRLRVTEVPITFVDRKQGSSKMNAAVLVDYLRQLAALGGLSLTAGGKQELGILAGIVLFLDLLVFHLLLGRGLELDVVHISSFLLACNLGYLIIALSTKEPLTYFGPAALLRYQLLLLLALFLRGGIVAAMALWLPDSLLLLSLAAASCSVLAATTGYLFVSKKNIADQAGNWRLTALLVIIYTILLRLLYLGSFELIQEEAYYWNYSQHMAMGYLDHPPMVALLIWFGTHLFGNSEMGVRFGAFLCWFITASFSYNLTASVYGKRTALNALVLIAALPIFFATALVITPDAPLIACWAGALFFLHRALVDENACSWMGVGICLGLGLASKYTIVLLSPAIILFMLIDPRSRRWFFSPWPYLAALMALLIFSPVIFWNYQHDWASFLFQSQGRLTSAFMFSTPELLGAILLLLTPTGLLAVWTSSRMSRKQRPKDEFLMTETDRRHRLFAFCMALVPLSVFVVVSFSREVKLSWAGPLWLAFIPLMASSLPFRGTVGRLRPFVLRLWPATLLSLALSYGLVLHYFSLGIPGIPFGTNAFLFGFNDLASQIEQTVKSVEDQKGTRPLVAGMDKYRIASGLAFYRNKANNLSETPAPDRSIRETTGRQLFNMDALMYNYWLSPDQAADRDILVVAERREYLAGHLFFGKTKRLGKIRSFSIKKLGKEVGSYYYRFIVLSTPAGLTGSARSVAQQTMPITISRTESGKEQ